MTSTYSRALTSPSDLSAAYLCLVLIRARGDAHGRPGQHQDGHDNAIQTKHLGEDEDQHHADVQPRLLRAGADYIEKYQ